MRLLESLGEIKLGFVGCPSKNYLTWPSIPLSTSACWVRVKYVHIAQFSSLVSIKWSDGIVTLISLLPWSFKIFYGLPIPSELLDETEVVLTKGEALTETISMRLVIFAY